MSIEHGSNAVKLLVSGMDMITASTCHTNLLLFDIMCVAVMNCGDYTTHKKYNTIWISHGWSSAHAIYDTFNFGFSNAKHT